ncbi:PE domain-containing protein [Pseudonocardia bannensis]|uniref:PE domain-containing protein n=1 Tax=Pseudonocardia bannensis TaxID=630973 RepID=A0A848DR00_9PSEU|nr:PE domain-containing protein [Pseudonocardia bannensis]NMH95280.1 PE domain-containing protein [Pseudonocardia bannensis]
MTQPRPGPVDPVFIGRPQTGRAQAREVLLAVQGAGAVDGEVVPGTLYVDPERAQACIDGLGKIVDDLRFGLIAIQRTAFAPPGRDEVSVNMANNAATMASRADAYVEAWAASIEATKEALSRQLWAYEDVDQTNAQQRS